MWNVLESKVSKSLAVRLSGFINDKRCFLSVPNWYNVNTFKYAKLLKHSTWSCLWNLLLYLCHLKLAPLLLRKPSFYVGWLGKTCQIFLKSFLINKESKFQRNLFLFFFFLKICLWICLWYVCDSVCKSSG